MSAIPSSDAAPAGDKPVTNRRAKLLINLGGAVVIAVLLYGAYEFVVGRHYVETDNAYVGADTAWVSPLVSGPVARVLVQETQVFKAGDPLVDLDDADTRIMVEQAQAALDAAERKVRADGANDVALAGQVQARTAYIARAKADLERARTDLERRQAASTSARITSGSFAVALTTTAWERSGTLHQTRMAEVMGATDPTFSHVVAAMRGAGMSAQQAVAAITQQVSDQASFLGVIDFFRAAGWCLLALIPLIWLTKKSKGGH